MGHLIILGWLYQDPLISKLLSLPLSCVCSALGLSLGGVPQLPSLPPRVLTLKDLLLDRSVLHPCSS